MKKHKANKRRRRNESPSHPGTVRDAQTHKGRFLVFGGMCGAVILGLGLTRSFWRTGDKSTDGPKQEGTRQAQPLAGMSLAGGTTSSHPPEDLPGTPAVENEAAEPKLYTEENLEKETMEVLNRLIQDFPDSADPLGLMGDVYAEQGKTAEAMKCWQQCTELEPRRADSYVRMTFTAVERGEFERAVKIARQALKIDPRMPGIHTQLGRALRRLGKPREALAALEKAVEIPTNSTENLAVKYYLLGQAHQQLQQYEQAGQCFRKALQLNPGYTEACYGIATVVARLGQKDEADKYRKMFREMKARDWKTLPDKRDQVLHQKLLIKSRHRASKTHTNAGIMYSEHGRKQTAEKHWLRAAQLDPANMECRKELAILYLHSGRNKKALRMYEQLADFYQQIGRNQEALRMSEKLIQLAPENPKYHVFAGVLLARMNRIEDARQAVKQAIELEPDNATYRQIYDQMQKKK